MNKTFARQADLSEDDDDSSNSSFFSLGVKNYITPEGYKALREELTHLVKIERPEVVSVVSWAASNGDRSENGDYLYGKKRLREIDKRIRFLTKRIESAEVVDPIRQKELNCVFFGATVSFMGADACVKTVKIVGADEVDSSRMYISWLSPVARALMKARVGDVVIVRTPVGLEKLEVTEISYV